MNKSLTPMVRQYMQIKAKHPNHILMFRMGDFYEMFNEDAKTAASVLQIALTKRPAGNDMTMPLAGIPYHALDSYLSKLIKAGHKVAICEQVENPKLAKGIVKREVTRVVTPGTVVESEILDDKQNNFLAAVHRDAKRFGIAAVDLSTGRFEVTEFDSRQASEGVFSELWRLHPSEVLIDDKLDEELLPLLDPQMHSHVTHRPGSQFRPDEARRLLCEQFHVQNLSGFGANGLKVAIGAAGAIVHYLRETQRSLLTHVNSLNVYSVSDFMILDYTTQRSLELVEGIHGGRESTLLSIIDRTQTAMGGRMLRQWTLQPLKDLQAIESRQQAVQELTDNFHLRDGLSEALRGINDIERIISRVGLGTANARDLVALRQSMEQLPALQQHLSGAKSRQLAQLADGIDPLPDLRKYLQRSLVDSPPIVLREGGLIRDGFHDKVDELRTISRDSKSWIAKMRQQEIEKSGIQNLKIGYNKIFGYYIEISKGQLDRVPSDYIRKQTLVNAERFITPELKEKEEVILNAQEKLQDLEFEIFEEIRTHVREHTAESQALAHRLATLDCLFSFAEAAIAGNYVKPQMTDDGLIEIADGRHPVLEAVQSDPPFVPNHTYLSPQEQQILLITGPNMAGKSTYIRQVALIVLMAHMGSFVPARQASICLVDRIFTRVGAMDQIAKGQSTFLVEMSETANILNNASDKSLVILDEIGRGTSTYDGLSIAWAVLEYLHGKKGRRPKTLFATHYHELIALEEHMERLKNYHVAVLEEQDQIVFLYKIERGSTDRSYGIYAAQLAGVPRQVVQRARDILSDLQEGNAIWIDAPARGREQEPAGVMQLSFFENLPHPVVEKLREIKPENLTPIEALNLLNELHRESRE